MHKHYQPAFFVLIMFVAAFGASAQSGSIFLASDPDSVKGRKIMEAVDDSGSSPDAMISETTMVIVKGDPGNPIVKRSKTYRKEYSDSSVKTLSETVYPSRMKILSHSYPNRTDDVWIKLSSGSPKRISGSGKQGYIQNSHFTYEDMESTNLDQYSYTYLGEVSIKVEGRSTLCYKIESEKISGEESRYSKSQIYVRKADLYVVRTDMWDQNGNPHKTERILQTARIQGHETYTMAVKIGISLVDDPTTPNINEGKNQYTIMEMTNIKVDDAAQIDESLFRKESM